MRVIDGVVTALYLFFGAEVAKADVVVPAPIEVGALTVSKTVTVVWSLNGGLV